MGFNITLDDSSPQIQYFSSNYTWSQNHTDDGETPNYFDGTFHGTFTDGDKMQLRFNGTAVYVYGAKRNNHGAYQAYVDNNSPSLMSGYSANDAIQSLLFWAGGLSTTSEHVVTLINKPSETSPAPTAANPYWMDIDYIVITTADAGTIYTTQIDDSSPLVSYSGAWSTTPPSTNMSDYYNSTAHYTSTTGNSLSFPFNGSAIQLFGSLNVGHGNYTVAVDGKQYGPYNGTWFNRQYGVPLFQANNLTDGPHSILVTDVSTGNTNGFDFDYAVVNSTINPKGVTNTTSGTNTTTSGSGGGSGSSSSGSNAGAIAGGVVGGIAALVIAGFLFWFFYWRKKRHGYHHRSDEPLDLNGEEVKPFPHGGNNAAYATPGYVGSDSDGHLRSPSAREADLTSTPFLSAVPPPPASNATSYPQSAYPHSINPPSTEAGSPSPHEPTQPNPFSTPSTQSFPAGITASSSGSGSTPYYNPYGQSASSGTSTVSTTPAPDAARPGSVLLPTPNPTGLPPPIVHATKTNGVALPYTAQPVNTNAQSTTSSSPTVGDPRSPDRMYVPGRELDMGPAPLEHHEFEDAMLPPDYQQATQPLPGQHPPASASGSAPSPTSPHPE